MSNIGIDAGTSIIKLVNVDKENNIIHKRIIDKMPILQALEEFIHNENIRIEEVSKIVITGIGSAEVGNNIYDIPTIKVDEFQAIGKGGLYLSNNERGLVVSIGTGTAFVKAEGTNFSHVGGTGVGGGTLLNLCKKISCINSFNEINELILKGNLHNVDLTIKDMMEYEVILGLRKVSGINEQEFQKKFNQDLLTSFPKINEMLKKKYLLKKGLNIFLNPTYYYVQNYIISEII